MQFYFHKEVPCLYFAPHLNANENALCVIVALSAIVTLSVRSPSPLSLYTVLDHKLFWKIQRYSLRW